MSFKIGELYRVSPDACLEAGRYIGQLVTVVDLKDETLADVEADDGKVFLLHELEAELIDLGLSKQDASLIQLQLQRIQNI